jgi:uncharacterized protein YggL (DUF469 family)
MKKRIRKKLHKGEFQQHGISIMIPADVNNIEDRLHILTDIADENHILFVGGGLGRFVLPSEEYGDLDIPKKVESLIKYMALSNEPQLDCIIGYFIHPFEKEINNDIADKVKSKLEESFGNDLEINCKIDLWN